MRNYQRSDLQALVLLVKGKTALGKYLGVDSKTLNEIWQAHDLKAPADHVRTLGPYEISGHIAMAGSLAGAAEQLGVSESFLRGRLRELHGIRPPDAAAVQSTMERLSSYDLGSLALGAHILGIKTSQLNAIAFEEHLDLRPYVRYDLSNHQNGKGRRAELAWAALEGDLITQDLNTTQGSQAPYDFDHKDLGRVNVKGSRRYKLRAATRRSNPYYWKISTRGLENCDVLAVMAYDARFTQLLHKATFKLTMEFAAQIGGKKTIRFQATDKTLAGLRLLDTVDPTEWDVEDQREVVTEG